MRIVIIAFLVILCFITIFSNYDQSNSEAIPNESVFDEARVAYDFDLVKDPVSGKLTQGAREAERTFALSMQANNARLGRLTGNHVYIPAGPLNAGGRTRAVAYDIRHNGTTNKVIIAGGVSGGIMRSSDGGQTWNSVAPNIEIHSLSAVAQDPRIGFENNWYAGGGEAYANSVSSSTGDLYLGYGLLKSTDNGLTWARVPFTAFKDINGNVIPAGTMEALDHPMDNVHRIVVHPLSGIIYIAAYNSILKSSDGGVTFQVVFQVGSGASQRSGQTDVAIAGDKVLMAVNGSNPAVNARGVWVSTSGNAGTWQRIAGGTTPGVDQVTGWRGNVTGSADPFNEYGKRILLAVAPSDPTIFYVIYQNGVQATVPEIDLFSANISANSYTWENRSNTLPGAQNPTSNNIIRTQLGYNLFIKVTPTNPKYVFIGGVQPYRANLNFPTATFILVSIGHVDQHDMVFNPTEPEQALMVNDGGIFKGNNVTSNPNFLALPNYQTLQYYKVSMDPEVGRNNFSGGSQDNGISFRDVSSVFGNQLIDSNRHRFLQGADGASTGISKRNGNVQHVYAASQVGLLVRYSAPSTTAVSIIPNGLTANSGFGGFGEFITNFKLNQDNSEDLYYVNFNRLFRTTTASSASNGSGWTELAGVSQAVAPSNPTTNQSILIRGMALSRGPYNSSHTLYIGTNNSKIYRFDNPRNAVPNTPPVDITPSTLQGNVHDIAVNPNDDNEVLAVVSNYNTVSIWWTNNAKSASPAWKNAEGNLTSPSVRSCIIVVKKDAANNSITEYFVGTSVGLYSVENLGTILAGNGQPVWQREGGSVLNYAVVQSLAYRPADNILLIGTHGNGMYYTNTGTPDFRPNAVTAIDVVNNDPSFIKMIYPSLTTGKVYFRKGTASGVKKLIIQVYAMNGQKIRDIQTPYVDGSIDLTSNGTYVIEIRDDKNRYRHTQMIIKK